MIARYRRAEMERIWSDRRRYQAWLQVELAVCEELSRIRLIPSKDWKVIKSKVTKLIDNGGVEPSRVDFHESKTKHDVIAFTTAVAEKVGPVSRYIHFGLTSSDVVDSALSIVIAEAGQLIREDIVQLLKTLKTLAIRYKSLPTIGRSHGISAEPTSFGLKFLSWHSEWKRNLERLDFALEDIRVGKLSGAVGVNPHWGPTFEKNVLKRLSLKREEVSTQVIPRDRHAFLLNVLSGCGSSIERIAVELRHLQRSEVAEVMEGFSKGQKGSSAMPHKRNPISSENLTGCARLLRSYGQVALENVALWHERDISHSAAERVVFPDAFTLLDYALHRLNGVLGALVVREDHIRANLIRAGSTVYSGHYLLELVKAGATREEAYLWVQECALESFEKKNDFVALLTEHLKIRKYLTPAMIRKLGSTEYQLRHVRDIYREAL